MKSFAAVVFAAVDAQESPEVGLGGTKAGVGQEIATRLFQQLTDKSWSGKALGAWWRTGVSRVVDWYMDRKIDIDPLSTHKIPLGDIIQACDLMHAGKSIR